MFLDFHTHKVSQDAGVCGIFNVILRNREEEEWKNRPAVSVGIHPWYIPGEGLEELFDILEDVAALPMVKCIGETGLDALKGGSLKDQEEVFIRQIRIAEKVGKPVVVHCVRAFNELLSVIKKVGPRVPLVIHGFNRKPELARELISAGFYLSFGMDIGDKLHVQRAFQETPADRFFLETDGREGVEIQEIYEKAAVLRGVALPELQKIIHQNYIRL